MWKGLTLFSLAGAAIAVVPAGPRETVVPLTRGALHGTVDVVSFGVAQLAVDDRPVSALHVRETFANERDNVPWTIELAATTLQIRGSQDRKPILISSDLRTLPLAQIGRGEKKIVDLYFALPASDAPDAFTVTYRLNTPDHRFLGKAELAKATRTADAPEWLPALGWAPIWWSDPTHGWPAYDRKSGRLLPRAPSQIVVVRAPHTFYEELTAADDEWPRTDECNDW